MTRQNWDLEKIQADVAQKCGEVVKAAKEFKLDPARTLTRDYAIAPIRDNTQRLCCGIALTGPAPTIHPTGKLEYLEFNIMCNKALFVGSVFGVRLLS
jgi:hypothetical protein